MKRFVIKLTGILALMLVFFSLSAQNQIVGTVNYHDNPDNPLPSVTLELYDSNNLIATTMTNSLGEFTFSNIPVGDYTIESYTSLPVGEIDLVDASLILQYLLGLITFTDYEFAAADVNGSGNVTFGDYMLVLISYLMQGNPFPTDEWQFDEVDVSVTSSRDTSEPAMVWGTSTGDVEGIWLPGGRDIDNLPVNDEELTIIDNTEKELVIGSDYDHHISGFNLNLVYPTNLIEITEVTGPDNNFHFDLEQETGILKVIWLDENSQPGERFFGETLFRVKVKQKEGADSNMNGLFSILEGGMVLDGRSNEIDDIEIKLPKVLTQESTLELSAECYPNPVVNDFNIKLSSPKNTVATIMVFDLNGRLVLESKNTVFKGTQLLTINTNELSGGQYVYKINISGNNLHGRFQK